MPRVSKFTQLEQEYGKPIGEILVEKLDQLGSIEKLSVDIGVTFAHTSRKLKSLGIKKQPHWVLPEKERA